MARFTHYIYICVYIHHIWRPQGGSSHGAGPWATDIYEKNISSLYNIVQFYLFQVYIMLSDIGMNFCKNDTVSINIDLKKLNSISCQDEIVLCMYCTIRFCIL